MNYRNVKNGFGRERERDRARPSAHRSGRGSLARPRRVAERVRLPGRRRRCLDRELPRHAARRRLHRRERRLVRAATGTRWQRITLDHPTCTFASTLGRRPSAQCIDLQDPDLKVRDGVDVLAPLCSNYQNGGLWWAHCAGEQRRSRAAGWSATACSRTCRSRVIGVFRNRPTTTGSASLAVNSLCRALPAHTSQPGTTPIGSIGVDVFSSYISGATRAIRRRGRGEGRVRPTRLRQRRDRALHRARRVGVASARTTRRYEDVVVRRVACPVGVNCTIARGIEVGTADGVTSDVSVSHTTFAGLAGYTGRQ